MCCPSETFTHSASSLADQMRIESLTAMNRTIRRRPRRVSFEKAEVVTTVTPSSLMSDEERQEIWYQQSDLSQFKSEARNLCRQIRADQRSMLERPILGCDSSSVDCTRGLEHRVSVERQKNKLLAMRAILKAQSRYGKSEQLAVVASRCTAWAKEIALCTGYQDFYHVYNPALVHLVPRTPSVKFPLIGRKRNTNATTPAADSSDSESEERHAVKRQRTMSPVPSSSGSTVQRVVVL